METERLLVRPARREDAAALIETRNSLFMMKYNCCRECTLEAFEEELLEASESTKYVLERKADQCVLGMVFVEKDELRWGVSSRSLSYFLGEQYARQGYMKEALTALMAELFALPLDCLCIRVFSENTASLALVRSLGFHQDGVLRRAIRAYGDIVYDDVIFSMLAEEYRQQYTQKAEETK